jgi:hypothetical protein
MIDELEEEFGGVRGEEGNPVLILLDAVHDEDDDGGAIDVNWLRGTGVCGRVIVVGSVELRFRI